MCPRDELEEKDMLEVVHKIWNNGIEVATSARVASRDFCTISDQRSI